MKAIFSHFYFTYEYICLLRVAESNPKSSHFHFHQYDSLKIFNISAYTVSFCILHFFIEKDLTSL